MPEPLHQTPVELAFTGERVVPGQVEPDLWNEHIARYLFAAKLAAGKRVADLGCGTGYGTALLAEIAQSAVGVDISGDAIEYARNHYRRPNLKYAVAAAAEMGLPDASCELITCFELIEHLENWPELLYEAKRLLAPGGVFLVSTPNKNYYAEARVEAGANPYHVHEFEFGEFAAALAAVFPSVTLYTQNQAAATVIQPVAAVVEAEFRMEPVKADPATAQFYIALCAVQAGAKAPSFVHVPSAANMLRERELHIARIDAELAVLRKRHVEVQGELLASNEWAKAADARADQAQAEVREAHAALQSAEARFAADIAAANEHLHQAENVIDERTRWAQSLNAQVEQLRGLVAAVQSSRWFKVGRKLGLGPKLD